MKKLSSYITVLVCILSITEMTIAQKNEKDHDLSMIIEAYDASANSLQNNGIYYKGDRIKLKLVLNEKNWDGVKDYYVYVIKMDNAGVKLIYPSHEDWGGRGLWIVRRFPKDLDRITKDFVLMETIVDNQFGKNNFFLIMTESPINDYEALIKSGNNGELNVKEECIKLVKGSKLSYFSRSENRNMIVQTLQFETRPLEESQGVIKSFNTSSKDDTRKRNVFVNNDTSEIFYTPIPQWDIIRDSFPTIDILDPQLDVTLTKGIKVIAKNDGKKVLIRGIAVDRLHGIQKITLNGLSPDSIKESIGYFDYLYELKNGLNTIDVAVENNQGYKRTIRLKFLYTPKTGEIIREGRDYLMIIGINNYKTLLTLYNATKDAQDFKQLMMKDFGYRKENIFELYDGVATKENIYDRLKIFLDSLDKNDRLLVYYSGHGFYEEKPDMGYWLPVNAAINKNDGYLEDVVIARYIQKMTAKNIFIIADACFSGSLLRAMGKENSGDYKSRMVLCSGKLAPVPDGIPGTNSPFAQKVFEFFKGSRGDTVLASDLIYHVKKSFPPTSTQKPVGGAIDEVGDENGDFIFKRNK